MPIMCNACNMAFRKSDFMNYIKSLEYRIDIASGDDLFFLQYINKTYSSRAIRFLNSKNAMVETCGVENYSSLINQRVRWSKKSSKLNFGPLQVLAIFIFSVNFLVLSSLLLLIFNHEYYYLFIPSILFKFTTERLLYNATREFYDSKIKLMHFMKSFTLYPFFVCHVALAGIGGSYKWKERKLKY